MRRERIDRNTKIIVEINEIERNLIENYGIKN